MVVEYQVQSVDLCSLSRVRSIIEKHVKTYDVREVTDFTIEATIKDVN